MRVWSHNVERMGEGRAMQTYIEEAARRERPDVLLLQELSRPGPERDRSTDGEWIQIETMKQKDGEETEGKEGDTAERSGAKGRAWSKARENKKEEKGGTGLTHGGIEQGGMRL